MTEPDAVKRAIGLSRTPATLLAVLCDARGRIVPYDYLATEIWPSGRDGVSDQAIHSALRRVRRALAMHWPGAQIVTHYGMGLELVASTPPPWGGNAPL